MEAYGISHFELVLLVLLVIVAALALLARRIHIAYPIVVVLGGLVLSLPPYLPRVSLDPNIVFLVILPPLLFSAGFQTSWRDFRDNLVSIFMLAFGLVAFTVLGVAATSRWMFPAFDWKLGLVLGSIVAPTDAIAATATAKRLGLPRRLTDLLEAESTVNDGSGLVALKFTLAMIVTGVTPSVFVGIGTLFYLVAMAVVIGLVVAFIIRAVQSSIEDAPIEITISLITPYVAYLAAESAHCSGVLATLVCGMFLGYRRSHIYSLHARIESFAVWRTVDFILNGVVFLLLGLQLRSILSQIPNLSFTQLLTYGALFSAIVIALRLLWVFPSAWISTQIQRHMLRKHVEPASWGSVFLVGWAGMRGVLSLAAALSLPEKVNNGSPFPHRSLIIFLAFCVIVATLVAQGLSMPALIRLLGLATIPSREEEFLARREMINAALKALREIRTGASDDGQFETYDQLERYYRRRLSALDESPRDPTEQPLQNVQQQRFVAQELRDVERSVALRLRNENKIHEEVLRHLEHELDLLDARYAESGF